MSLRWKTYNSGLLSLKIPFDWSAQEHSPGTILLRDPAKDLRLHLIVTSSPTVAPALPGIAHKATNAIAGDTRRALARQQVERDLAHWVHQQRHVQTKQGPKPIAGVHHAIFTVEGREPLKTGVHWLKRMLRRGPYVAWRFWAVENSHMMVLASCDGRPEVQEYYRKVVDQLVASIHLPDREFLVGRHFTEAVATMARDYFPSTAVALVDDAHLKFGASHVDLGTLHRRYVASPEQLSQHVRAFFRDLQRLNDNGGAPSWEAAKQQVMPCIVENNDITRYGEHPALQDWVNDLSIVYVVDDQEQGFRSVTEEECELWGVDAEQLHEHALENLINKSGELTMEGSKADGYTMLALSKSDAFNAARILLPDLHRKLREHLGQTFYVAIPSREFLLAFATKREDVLNRVRRQIANDYARMESPISPKLFLVTPDGITGDPDEAEDFSR